MKRTPLKRSTKPLKRTPIKRKMSPPLSCRELVSIGRKNTLRKKRPGPARRVSVVRDQKYMDWLKKQFCIACSYCVGGQWGTCQLTPSEPAHTVNNGMRSKGSDSSCVPACNRHHAEMDGRLGTKTVTKEQFAAKYGLDLAAIAAEHYARFKGEN